MGVWSKDLKPGVSTIPDRLTGLQVFVRAIRLGSLSAAARERGITPAMAGRHLDELEARLGATLVHRSTRRLSLTEAGTDFFNRAEDILADLDDAEAEVSARSAAVEGLLRVSAPVTFGALHIAPLTPLFRARHPNVTLELGLNDRYVDLLEERWDMAVRIGRLQDSSLIARKLVPVRLSICASPDYLAQRGVPASIKDLAAHDCLGFTLGNLTGVSTWGFGSDGQHRVSVRGSLHANNGEALVAAACMGQGLVYGPRFIAAAAIASGRLVEVRLREEVLDLGAVHAITHPSRRPAAKTRAWIDFLARELPGRAEGW